MHLCSRFAEEAAEGGALKPSTGHVWVQGLVMSSGIGESLRT